MAEADYEEYDEYEEITPVEKAESKGAKAAKKTKSKKAKAVEKAKGEELAGEKLAAAEAEESAEGRQRQWTEADLGVEEEDEPSFIGNDEID